MREINIVAICVSSTFQIGLYQNNKLFDIIKLDNKSSYSLPIVFDDLLKKYDIRNIVYTNTPGSFMAIKISYVFFKTLEITKGIKLYAIDGFFFNNNQPIKAIGNKYFFKELDKIVIKPLNDKIEQNFTLPDIIELESFSTEAEPIYILPSV